MNIGVFAEGIWNHIKGYFNISADLVAQPDAESEIRSGVSFRGSQLLILIFAIFIASLGLNTNSIPVIIGAMLISPLMGPIIGMGLAIGIEDFGLLRRSFKNLALAVIGSLAASALYFLCSPIYEGSRQLLARTSPTIYDVLVGFFGGAAGIISICCKNKAQVMPGVAIATSLMPPLCTAGYGLATWQANFFFGALYLFFINALFILFAAWIGVKVMKYKILTFPNAKRAQRIQIFTVIVVTMTIALSIFLTYRMLKKSSFMSKAQQFVTEYMVFPNTQVLSHEEYMEHGHGVINATLIGEALPLDSLKLALLAKLDSMGLNGTTLNIRQGFSLSDQISKAQQNQNMSQIVTILQDRISVQQQEIDSLRLLADSRYQFTQQSVKILPELQVISHNIKNLAFTDMILVGNETKNLTDTIYLAFLESQPPLRQSELNTVSDFLRIRLDNPYIKVLDNPIGFVWPSKE